VVIVPLESTPTLVQRRKRIPLRFEGGAIPNTDLREHIRPTDLAPIIRPLDRDNEFMDRRSAPW
jgi:hypothetical protein